MKDCTETKQQKFISIIIPVYNAQETIEKCLHSIMKQVFKDFECILVNDGSSDASLEIMEDYVKRDNRFFIINQENQGVSQARNNGMQSAKGRYVLFVDSDDFIPEQYCLQLVEQLLKDHEQIFVWASIDVLTPDGEKTGCFTTDNMTEFVRRDVHKLSKYGLLNSPYCKLYKREVLEKYKIQFPKELSIAEDLLFNLRYLDVIGEQPIILLKNVSYQYVRYEGSLDNRYIMNYWNIHKEILDILKQKSLEWNAPEQDTRLFYERYWDYVQHALYNTMSENNQMTLQEKLRVNNRILQEREVQTCISFAKEKIRKREYIFFKYLNYTCYYYMKKLFGKG